MQRAVIAAATFATSTVLAASFHAPASLARLVVEVQAVAVAASWPISEHPHVCSSDLVLGSPQKSTASRERAEEAAGGKG